MPTPPIVLLTHSGSADLTRDDQFLAEALRDAADVDVLPWDAPDATERAAASRAAIIRSTWNYTEKLSAFHAFVDEQNHRGTTLLNPAAVVRWNCDKHYLDELQRSRIAVLPTVFLRRGADTDAMDLAHLMDRRGWRDVVVKPTVSATAKGLFRVERTQASGHQERFEVARLATDLMVQPVAPEIEADGEWSLMFFGGRYSHAVRKRAACGDFRVQGDFGGTARAETPPGRLVADAERLMDWVHRRFTEDAPLLYARVDGIERGGRLVLMELELIEPELFFRCDPAAAARCVESLLGRI